MVEVKALTSKARKKGIMFPLCVIFYLQGHIISASGTGTEHRDSDEGQHREAHLDFLEYNLSHFLGNRLPYWSSPTAVSDLATRVKLRS